MPDCFAPPEPNPLKDIRELLRKKGYNFTPYPPPWKQNKEPCASYKGHPNFQLLETEEDGTRRYRVWGFGEEAFHLTITWNSARGTSIDRL